MSVHVSVCEMLEGGGLRDQAARCLWLSEGGRR